MSEPKQMISGFPSPPIDPANGIVGPADIYPSNDQMIKKQVAGMSEPLQEREDLADIISRMAPVFEAAYRLNKTRQDFAKLLIRQVGPANGRDIYDMANAYIAAANELSPPT